jgi:hypothetical protein
MAHRPIQLGLFQASFVHRASLSNWRNVGTIPGDRTMALDGEIADPLVFEHVRLFGRLTHLLDRDRIKIAEKGFARPRDSNVRSLPPKSPSHSVRC